MAALLSVMVRAVEDPTDLTILEIVDEVGEISVLGCSEYCSICLGPFLPGEYLMLLRCRHM